MRSIFQLMIVVAAGLLSACIGGSGKPAGTISGAPTPNTMALTVDSGPAAATGAINHPYVTVKVCAAGSQTQCVNIDHVLLDTGSSGLRLVRSVLAAGAVTLSTAADAQGHAIEECVTFGGGQTWGPVAFADVTLAGEVATKLPVQVAGHLRSEWNSHQRRVGLRRQWGARSGRFRARLRSGLRRRNHAAAALLRLHDGRRVHR